MNDKTQKTIHTCKLDDGTIVPYDVCGKNPNFYDSKIFRLIGAGVIYSVDGVEQNSTQKLLFYVRKDQA